MNFMKITMYKAGKGDSFLVEWNNLKMLVDSGTPATQNRKKNPKFPCSKELDYIFLTHIDYDHIGGFLKLISSSEKNPFKNEVVIYCNLSNKITIDKDDYVGFKHGTLLQEELERLGISCNDLVNQDVINLPGACIHAISPKKEHLSLLLNYWDEYVNSCEKVNVKGYVSSEEKKFHFHYPDTSEPSKINLKNDIINITSIAFIMDIGCKKVMFLSDTP